MSSVLVTGAMGPLGRRVCRLLDDDPEVERVVQLDGLEDPAVGPLDRLLDGIDTVIHLGSSLGPGVDGTGAATVDVDGARRLLDAAAGAGVERVVVLSSAMVYGAWADNAVPLTEDVPLRPNPESEFAVRKAEVERLVGAWRAGHPGARVAVLRPTIALAEEQTDWLAWSLWGSGGVQADDLEPPAQFVHLDDLAAAVDLARRSELDGAYNVAPDGWIAPERLRALVPPTGRLRLPEPAARRLGAIRWRAGLTPTPPSVLPYTVHPWVVASDRLRAAGWVPANTNEEVLVLGTRPGPLESLSGRRRQELALGGTVLAAVGLVAGAVALILRWRRRRR